MPSTLLEFPGLIDCHVHFREPGETSAEDMESGAAAALAGGILTVCDMPNTNPPTSSVAHLQEKIALTKRAKPVAIRLFFGVAKREHLKELTRVKREDIVGVKLYFDHSTGNQKADEDVIEETFALCAERGLPVVCHCEDAVINNATLVRHAERSASQARASTSPSLRYGSAQHDVAGAQSKHALHSLFRPPESEQKAVHDAIILAKKSGAHLHIAHLSTSFGLNLVREAKADKLNVTCEAAPHHLFLTVEDYEELGALAKMNPPLRTRDHVEALWEGIFDGTIDCVASDHAPHTLTAKRGVNTKKGAQPTFAKASVGKQRAPTTTTDVPSGVPGVETMLPLLLSCMTNGPKDAHGKTRKPVNLQTLKPSDILRLLYENPLRIFSLTPSTQKILIDPDAVWTIRTKDLHSKCGWTPYEGWEVRGKVVRIDT